MNDYLLETPNAETLSRQVAVHSALKKRRQHQSNIWFFDSPKNSKRFTISGDVAFMHLVCLEGEPHVSHYIPSASQANQTRAGMSDADRVGAQVFYSDGRLEWWDFQRLTGTGSGKLAKVAEARECESKSLTARAAGAGYRIKTDQDLLGQEVFFDNWLTLCAAISRCRGRFLGEEAEVFSQRIALQHAVILDNFLDVPGIDVAHMLAVIAMALQSGSVRADLRSRLLSRMTLISRSTA